MKRSCIDFAPKTRVSHGMQRVALVVGILLVAVGTIFWQMTEKVARCQLL